MSSTPKPQTPPLSISQLALVVHDLESMCRFYRDAIGLHVLAQNATTAQLGVDGAVLLELRRDTNARRSSPREAGLFHTAFLLPTRPDLGRWLAHAAASKLVLQGASDHLVSEAIYLADPEGNGIEVYADRPTTEWQWTDGRVKMATERLDTDALIATGGGQPWNSCPSGTTIGHVHLQVGDIPQAEAFYAGLLGFDITNRYPGGTFYSTSFYHHHLATNVWNSRGAGMRQFPCTGLAELTLIAHNDTVLAGIAQRIEHATATPSGLSMQDPWGSTITCATHKN